MHSCTQHNHCVDSALQKAESICEGHGLRFTELRRRVLQMIWESHAPAKAYDLLDKLKTVDASAKPPTVYRTLDFLLENGLVHKLNSLNAYVGCSHPQKHSECYFLICNQCGEVKECCSEALSEAITGIAGKSKFRLKHVTLEMEGECRECRSRA